MTHTTEQERADFEAWARGRYPSIDLTRDRNDYSKALAKDYWSLWQAARRAPAVPVPQGWKITEEMHVAAVKVLHRASGVDGLPQRMVDAMLAAAPQPPEAESMISSREVVSNPGSGVKVTRLNLSEAGRAALQSKASHIPDGGYSVSNATLATPVQMPEYGIDTANHAGVRVRGYTKQQVRKLLATHGIEVAP